MIRFSQMTFVRHVGGRSLLWRPRTGACIVLEDAEPFLRHVGWTPRPEAEIVADIAADFGVPPETVAGDFREFVGPPVAEGLLTTEHMEHDRLPLRRGLSVRIALVYDGELAPSVEASGYFDAIVSSRDLLGL